MANKITTKSYTIKRLKDCGYSVNKLDDIEYSESDRRKWTIVVDGGCSTVFLTCMKDGTIHLYDGNRYLSSVMRLDTDSIEVLIEFFNERGIVNKHRRYGEIHQETNLSQN